MKKVLSIKTCKRILAEVGVFIFKRCKRFSVKNAEETIDYILKNKVSVSRYGDGELYIMMGRGNGFQHPDDKLKDRLSFVLRSQSEFHIVCLPYPFECLDYLTEDAYGFWRGYLGFHFFNLLRMIPKNRIYFDTNFTRFYISSKNKGNCSIIIEKIRQLWNARDVCIVEGVGTRMGYGNDLLDNAASIKRIVCPSVNAFSVYPEILGAVKKCVPQTTLILCALGMTATVLAYDLSMAGYWAIDIGHLDIEYEWYKTGVVQKVAIENKSVNEVGVNIETDIDDAAYNSQILCRIVRK